MNRITQRLLPVLIVGLTGLSGVVDPANAASPAPKQKTILTFQAGEVFMLPELGAVIVADTTGLRVEFALPAAQRAKAYRQVDFETGDFILMVNGKRTKTVEQLEKIYGALAVGDEVKLGLRRGKEMRISSFKKAAKDDQPGHQMMIQTIEGDAAEHGAAGGGGIQKKTMVIGGGDGSTKTWTKTEGAGGKRMIMSAGPGAEMVLLLEAGLILQQDGEALVVGGVMDEAAKLLPGVAVAVGDTIRAVQGQLVRSAQQFNKIYGPLAVGTKVKLVFVHQGEKVKATFTKPEINTKPMMINK